jgi:hypothetical protein
MTILSMMRKQVPKSLRTAVRQEGAHFRVVYWHQYPHTVEEVVYSERFKTPEEAQKFIDDALRAHSTNRMTRSARLRPCASHGYADDEARRFFDEARLMTFAPGPRRPIILSTY